MGNTGFGVRGSGRGALGCHTHVPGEAVSDVPTPPQNKRRNSEDQYVPYGSIIWKGADARARTLIMRARARARSLARCARAHLVPRV